MTAKERAYLAKLERKCAEREQKCSDHLRIYRDQTVELNALRPPGCDLRNDGRSEGMTDIIDRLRRYAGGMCISTPTEQEAADIIEWLRAELSVERQWVEEFTRQAMRLSDELEAMKQQNPYAEQPDPTPERIAEWEAFLAAGPKPEAKP